MTYMTVFMGVMFYKVPAGLCLYFITSSLWGICERKFLSWMKAKNATGTDGRWRCRRRPPALPAKPASPNGNGKPNVSTKKQKQRREVDRRVPSLASRRTAGAASQSDTQYHACIRSTSTTPLPRSPPPRAAPSAASCDSAGRQCRAIVGQCFQRPTRRDLAETIYATCSRGQLHLPRDLAAVPATLYLWPTARSYTRQPSAELHLLGSPPLLDAALEAVCHGGRWLARPGEFTLRAFLAGRLDLTQAEAVLGVIDARGQAELEPALAATRRRPGPAARTPSASQLLDLLAHLEAGLDFVDEDIEFITAQNSTQQLAAAADQVAVIAGQMTVRGEAGNCRASSSLGCRTPARAACFNALAGGTAAIVSPLAGTTRDYRRRAGATWPAWPACSSIRLAKRAEADEPIAAAAQIATREQSRASGPDGALPRRVASSLTSAQSELPGGQLIVWTKCDLAAAPLGGLADQQPHRPGTRRLASRAIAAELQAASPEASVVAGTAERCRESLRQAAESLARAAGRVHVGPRRGTRRRRAAPRPR